MKTKHPTIHKSSHPISGWLALLALLLTFNLQLATLFAQGVSYTNWNDLVTNWVQTSAPTNDWSSIAGSSDGTKLAAVAMAFEGNPGGIYTSTNAGVTWTRTSAPTNLPWWSIASSSDGTKLVGVVGGESGYAGGIYTSTNAGASWTQTSGPDESWWSIASSSDGTKLAAVVTYGGLYTSTNAGLTWTQTSAPTNQAWLSIASSSDGTHLAAVVDGSSPDGNYIPGAIYTSTNAGVTWTQSSTPDEWWSSITSSSDGTHLAAVAYSGEIWTAQATIQTISPCLTISLSGNAAIISWPDTGGCTLQQCSDLTAGTWCTSGCTVTTCNGTNSITVTPATGNLFFRLTQP